MSLLSVQTWKRRRYPSPEQGHARFAFRGLLEQSLRPDFPVLDIEAGAKEPNAYRLRGRAREMIGADLTFSLSSLPPGTLHERLVNRTEGLADLRVNLLCGFRKSAGPQQAGCHVGSR